MNEPNNSRIKRKRTIRLTTTELLFLVAICISAAPLAAAIVVILTYKF